MRYYCIFALICDNKSERRGNTYIVVKGGFRVKRLPKTFFEKERPQITAEESLKDVESIMWNDDVLSGKEKAEIKLNESKVGENRYV